MKQLPNTIVLFDWKRKTHAKLGFPESSTMLVAVFDAHGERLGIVNEPVTDEKMAKLLALLPP